MKKFNDVPINLIRGCCFGHFDKKREECNKQCQLKDVCKKAVSDKQIKQIMILTQQDLNKAIQLIKNNNDKNK